MIAETEETFGAEEVQLRALAMRLRSMPQAHVSSDFTANVMNAIRSQCTEGKRPMRFVSVLMRAACFAVLLCGGIAYLHSNRNSGGWSTSMLVSCQRADGTFTGSSASPYVQAFAVTALARDASCCAESLDSAVGALVRDQSAAGGWANPLLSAQNVAALQYAAAAGAVGAYGAYRRGRRYLQTHGIGELSAADFMRAAKETFARLAGTEDRGLICGVALCAAR